ncbi:hypothetical protein GF325_00650 [Candidatus Bathyarchaeota archaeon]|nr:hypothetical protein [Candidatus Bathyarchaeota archaeon]
MESREYSVSADVKNKDEEEWEVPFMAPKDHDLLEKFIDAMANETDAMVSVRKNARALKCYLPCRKNNGGENHLPITQYPIMDVAPAR